MTFDHIVPALTILLLGASVSACQGNHDVPPLNADSEIIADQGMPPEKLKPYSDSAARDLLETYGHQETYAMLGWQANPDYEPMARCFEYWYGATNQDDNQPDPYVPDVEDCEQHVKDLSRLYASYGVEAKPAVFKSRYYWAQKKDFYPVWLKLVETWEADGGSEDDESFLNHPVCAKPLQEGWTGSEYFYDGAEHPLCRLYKLEALEKE